MSEEWNFAVVRTKNKEPGKAFCQFCQFCRCACQKQLCSTLQHFLRHFSPLPRQRQLKNSLTSMSFVFDSAARSRHLLLATFDATKRLATTPRPTTTHQFECPPHYTLLSAHWLFLLSPLLRSLRSFVLVLVFALLSHPTALPQLRLKVCGLWRTLWTVI